MNVYFFKVYFSSTKYRYKAIMATSRKQAWILLLQYVDHLGDIVRLDLEMAIDENGTEI